MSAQPLESRMAHLEGAYEQFDKRFADLISTMDARFAQVDARFAQVDARFADLIAAIEARFAQIDARFGQMDSRFVVLERKVDNLQWRMTSLILVTWITTMLAILFKH